MVRTYVQNYRKYVFTRDGLREVGAKMTFDIPGFYNLDCMGAMKEIPDGYFDLAVVDPPYGGGCNAERLDREKAQMRLTL